MKGMGKKFLNLHDSQTETKIGYGGGIPELRPPISSFQSLIGEGHHTSPRGWLEKEESPFFL